MENINTKSKLTDGSELLGISKLVVCVCVCVRVHLNLFSFQNRKIVYFCG